MSTTLTSLAHDLEELYEHVIYLTMVSFCLGVITFILVICTIYMRLTRSKKLEKITLKTQRKRITKDSKNYENPHEIIVETLDENTYDTPGEKGYYKKVKKKKTQQTDNSCKKKKKIKSEINQEKSIESLSEVSTQKTVEFVPKFNDNLVIFPQVTSGIERFDIRKAIADVKH